MMSGSKTRHPWLSTISWVFFDVDGTMYPPNTALNAAINDQKIRMLAKHLRCSPEEAERQYAQKLETLKSHTRTLDAFGIPGEAFHISMWDAIDPATYIQENLELARLLKHLSHIKFGLLTNANTRENIRRKLEPVGVSMDTFSVVLTSAETGVLKPDPQAFLNMLQSTGLSPDTIAYVGDRIEVDILPAKKIGVRTVLVSRDVQSSAADITVPTPQAFLQMLVRR